MQSARARSYLSCCCEQQESVHLPSRLCGHALLVCGAACVRGSALRAQIIGDFAVVWLLSPRRLPAAADAPAGAGACGAARALPAGPAPAGRQPVAIMPAYTTQHRMQELVCSV